MKNFWKSSINWISTKIGNICWKYKNGLTETELMEINQLLKPNYYVILTHRKNHLSTYFILFASWILTRKKSYWSHALMNLEDEVSSPTDFRLVEAITPGVTYSSFNSVFSVHGVALLCPKNMSVEHWTVVMDKAKSKIGKPYDTLFDLKNDNALSCVELIRTALMAEPDYEKNFSNFEAMIKKYKNLTPQMFYDCEDFTVAFEIRK